MVARQVSVLQSFGRCRGPLKVARSSRVSIVFFVCLFVLGYA